MSANSLLVRGSVKTSSQSCQLPDVDMPCFKEACQHPGVSACDVTLQPRCGALLGEGCPGHHWFEAIASIRGDRTSPVLVNVGANKGYEIAQFLSMYSQRPVDASGAHDEKAVAAGSSACTGLLCLPGRL